MHGAVRARACGRRAGFASTFVSFCHTRTFEMGRVPARRSCRGLNLMKMSPEPVLFIFRLTFYKDINYS